MMKFYKFNDPYFAVVGAKENFSLEDIITFYEENVSDEPETPVEISEEKLLKMFIKAYKDDFYQEPQAIAIFEDLIESDDIEMFLIDGSLV